MQNFSRKVVMVFGLLSSDFMYAMHQKETASIVILQKEQRKSYGTDDNKLESEIYYTVDLHKPDTNTTKECTLCIGETCCSEPCLERTPEACCAFATLGLLVSLFCCALAC